MSEEVRMKGLLLAFLTVLVISGYPGSAAAANCNRSAIQSISPQRTTIVSATWKTEPTTFCDIIGYVTTNPRNPNQVNFELGLPTDWNGRLVFIGNGGFAGSLEFPSVFLDGFTFFPLFSQLTAGYATVVTDTGHEGFFLDGSWALNNRAKQDDWLFRGVHVTAVAAKSITRRFYGQRFHAYFVGCSDGGREALVEAQRFPTDFDGIIAGDPAIGLWIPGFTWNQQHLTSSADNWLPPETLALIDDTVMKTCDGNDGAEDSLIQDPRSCRLPLKDLLCSASSGPNCLTRAQASTLKAIRQGATNANGSNIYSGFTISNVSDGWPAWLSGFVAPDAPGSIQPWSDNNGAPLQFFFQSQFLQFFVFDPQYDFMAFDFNGDDLQRAEGVLTRGGASGENPDLSVFRDRGGKLIIYHGWSDPAVSPLETVRYFRSVAHQEGSIARTSAYARLFMVPGMGHCAGSGKGPNTFDALPQLIDWVEAGTPPEQIIATEYQDNDPSSGSIVRSMPLCPYPHKADFKGGDTALAASWECSR
jgi:feruloyl esterase